VLKRRQFAALVTACWIGGSGIAAAEPIRFAVTDIEGLEALLVEFGPFRDTLQELTGDEIELFPVNSRTIAAEALNAEQVDFVLTGPAEYVVMQQLTGAEPIVAFTRPDYFSAVIVMADSPYQRPADLAGERVAFGDVGSTSNHLAPAQLLADFGVMYGQDFEAFHTSRPIGHEAMKQGDVAALATNYRSWLRIRDEETLPPGAFRVLVRGGDLPNDVLVVGAHVDPQLAKTWRDAFTEHSDALVEAILAGGEENQKYVGMRFLPGVQDSDYDYVRAMYATIGYPQFSEFVGD
jgi:phosphonate transport system substrate-binding protein